MADMSPGAVDRRLRQVALLERAALDTAERVAYREETLRAARQEMRQRRVSMSPEAVDARLREVSELSKLCLELARRS